ncbi:MAG: glycosyltransferase family 1 protein [Bacteroidetes bacterium]|nr:glycosyltransferase family 1 protein [Bacteroidota bacterium]
MRIGIEGQRLFRKKKHGMDMVALELIRNLQIIDKENEYSVFVKQDEDHCLQSNANFEIVELKSAPYPVWEQYTLPAAAKKANCSILHCTSNTAPIYTSIPLVVTLHDIIYMEKLSLLSKGFTNYQKFGNLYRRMIVPGVVKKCKKLITVSEFEKQRIADFFQINPEKVKAIYNGVSEHFHQVTDEEILINVKQKYNLPDRFFFFFGNTDPKKNTMGVLRALSLFLKRSDEKIPLVMLDYDREALAKLIEEVGDPTLHDYIILTGYVPNTELPGIYSLSTIFLYPSLRESFGIPMLEAMACGTPVITSNTSSMPEVAGTAALFIDPFKPEQITESIFKLIANQALRAELVASGLEHAKKFTWRNMTLGVLQVYSEIMSNK